MQHLWLGLRGGLVAGLVLGLSGCGSRAGQPMARNQSPKSSMQYGQVLGWNTGGINGVDIPGPDAIAFSAPGSGRYEGDDDVQVLASAGAVPWIITHTTAADRYPDWSPDKKTIVFTRTRDAGQPLNASGFGMPQVADIWTMNDIGQETLLFDAARFEHEYRYLAYPHFSPSGSRIAAAAYKDDGTSALVVMEPTLRQGAQAGNAVYYEITDLGGALSWSPDGRQIVFAARPKDDPRFRLYVVDVARDSAGPIRITLPPVTHWPADLAPGHRESYGQDTSPAWSPDGSYIIFTRSLTTYDDAGQERLSVGLYRCTSAGESISRLTTEPDYGAAFSADGSRLLFTRKGSAGAFALFVANADGSSAKKVIDLAGAGSADW